MLCLRRRYTLLPHCGSYFVFIVAARSAYHRYTGGHFLLIFVWAVGRSNLLPRDNGTSPAAGAAVPAGGKGNFGNKLSLCVGYHFNYAMAARLGTGAAVNTRKIRCDFYHNVLLGGLLAPP